MTGRHTTPSPTRSRGFIPVASLWSTNTSPTDEHSEGGWGGSELEAKRRSEMIDQALKSERAARTAARRKQRKVLFLGQSESGKSTLVKQFRLMQSPEAFAIERESWRSIVFLNIIRSILRVIDTITPYFNLKNPSDTNSQEFARLRLKLMPLRSVEESIVESLSSPQEVARSRTHNTMSGRSSRSSRPSPLTSGRNSPDMDDDFEDVYVHPESPWQRILQKCMRGTARTSTSRPSDVEGAEDIDDPAATLEACAADMKRLWNFPIVHEYLKQHGLFMEETSGFFLDDIERITSRGYVPTDDDILRTRVKTISPTETLLPNLEPGLEWRMYDVGGARRQRAKWAPFFDDMDLLIVLAPVSAFDQYLAEDKTVNRLQDSFDLWVELCKTTALSHIPVLLFLNKCDILDKKLKAGIKLADFLRNYGDRPNETKKVLSYLSKRFAGLRKDSKAPPNTPCHIHFTSVVDRATTQTVIGYVRDKIVMGHMRESYFV